MPEMRQKELAEESAEIKIAPPGAILVVAAALLVLILVAVGGEIFYENALDERVAFLEAMRNRVFVLNFGPHVAIIIWVIIIVSINYAYLVAKANIILEAGATAYD